MHWLGVLLFFFGVPFWETKPPAQWSAREIDTVLHASPWAEPLGPAPEVLVTLATAAPIEAAEDEARLRRKNTLADLDPSYAYYVTGHRDGEFVLAIAYPERAVAAKWSEEETRHMQEESVLLVGGKSWHIRGYFPPTAADPVLRLVFPRVVAEADKRVVFRLYLAGLEFPEREIGFAVKDLLYHGKLEM
jgi:hypothetical protein